MQRAMAGRAGRRDRRPVQRPHWRGVPYRSGGATWTPSRNCRGSAPNVGRLLRPEHGHRDRSALTAVEPRISAAVFGLHWPDALAEYARQITVPIEFEHAVGRRAHPREAGLALFDAFASKEKTLHANAGTHKELPRFEAEARSGSSSATRLGRHPSGLT